ncbi:MAG TPA: bifunctional diaminohydroxyphosphoribosylaminopyrimidine deaminase/5-amino-6-(5-phosphoribosylamino)uracil reductase RibD [Bacteroidota bacterium]|nr:bifunctional diaminohydroxyphosphoribosylaminopyrimidine deaminase/5-amino-6-(5-phosphoribosylamino)uracil reductase RibD [Bacteroidota bacterium]
MQLDLMQIDEIFMLECLKLAKKGAGYVSPNPMVGSVFVKDNKVIGRGYHKIFGQPHAEVNALKAVRGSLKGATLYTNLEPCNYYGKTPPCTEAIIKSKISRVVVGMKDPNSLVSGNGIRQLRQAGITVKVGVLEDDCKKLNEVFTKYITTGLPFVTLKIAQTLDGKIADTNGNSKWITNSHSRAIVHQLRSQYGAVLVGAGTVKKDNPKLTVRDVQGKNPIRIILDGRFTIDPSAKVLSTNSTTKTMLFTTEQFVKRSPEKKKLLLKKGVEIFSLPGNNGGKLSIAEILEILGKKGISSVLVEGGAQVFSTFLKLNLVDKFLFFVSPKLLYGGLDAFQYLQPRKIYSLMKLRNFSICKIDGDILIEAYS